MKCYFLNRPVDEDGKLIGGYGTRMHNIWKEPYDIEITE